MENINSSQYKNLFFEYSISEESESKAAIILLDGLPSKPHSKKEIIQKLSKKGFDIFFPRYEGTWESKGTFLENPPSKPIIEFIQKLKKGIKIKNKEYQNNNIFIIGASFGGGVALDISTKETHIKICVLSPVISFRKIPSLETLETYLREAHKNDYRFDSNQWKKLLEDKIWNLDKDEIKIPSKVWIGIGKDDDQIKEKEVIEFAKKNNIKIKVYDFGHITLSKINEEMLKEIINFFEED